MTITSDKFFTECTTTKGRLYKFDDMSCMVAFVKDNKNIPYAQYYVVDFLNPQHFIKTDQAVLLQHESFKSPMGGNIAAFKNADEASTYSNQPNTNQLVWSDLLN
jgi:copper chaperone NosL